MFAKYSVGAQRAAPALARHLLCPKTTLYSAGINKTWFCAAVSAANRQGIEARSLGFTRRRMMLPSKTATAYCR